jgi:transcriptional regulator with XRE-family HTH domain
MALGFTQEDLAARLGVDPTTVRRWENGTAENGPKPWLRPKLARHLQVSPEQLEELLAATEATDELLDADRTDSAADAAETHTHDLEQLRRSLHNVLAHGGITPASLDDWELTVVRHGAATRYRPAAPLLRDLTADFAELQTVISCCHSPRALRRLVRVAAHLSGLLCLTLIKLDDRTAFRRWARTARTAAAEADDTVTYSWVLAQEAYGHFYSDDFGEAVGVARQAQAVVPRSPCVGSVLAAALEARALAVLGRADETRAALVEAETILSALDDSALMASAFGYNEAQLRFHESNALTHLGDTRRARAAQDRALELVPAEDFMDRAFTQLDRAVCLARDGDPAAATSHALDTLFSLTDEQREGIIAGRAQQLVQSLPRQHQALSPAQEICDLLMLPTDRKG